MTVIPKIGMALPLTLCGMEGRGGPRDPKLRKSLNALKWKWVFKNGWNMFNFSNIDFKKLNNKKC